MARFQKQFAVVFFFSFVFFLWSSAQADPTQPFQVQGIRVEKSPSSCQTTLFVNIKNNSPVATETGLMVYGAQFQDLGNGQKYSSSIGTARLENLPAGQSREVSFNFIRERQKKGVSFRLKVGANSLAYLEDALPPVSEVYSAKIINPVFDQGSRSLRGSVANQSNVAIPKPGVQVYIAAANAPNDYKAGGGGQVSECLEPGVNAFFTRPLPQVTDGSSVKLNLLADGVVLDEKILGGVSLPKPMKVFQPAPVERLKTKKRIP